MVVGLGLSIGTRGVSGAVVEPPVVPATSGMNLDATWLPTGGIETALVNSTEASIRIDGTFAPGDTGILLEQGASISGLVLYLFGGTLYAQCGTGTNAGPDTTRAFLQYTLSETVHLIELSASVTHGRAALYVDGALVATDTFSNATLAGSDNGGLGRVYNIAAANFGGWTSDGDGVFTGTIDQAEIYLNQVTADVAI